MQEEHLSKRNDLTKVTKYTTRWAGRRLRCPECLLGALSFKKLHKTFLSCIHIIPLNVWCLNCVQVCETFYKISFLYVFVLYMLLAKRGGKLAKTQVLYCTSGSWFCRPGATFWPNWN